MSRDRPCASTAIDALMGLNRRQRFRADITRRSSLVHFIVVSTPWQQVIEWKELQPNSDLLGAFLELLTDYHRQGWYLNEFSSRSACFFTNRNGEHRVVRITADDPRLTRESSVGICRSEIWK